MKTFEKELPANYVETKVVDAKDKKFIIWSNVVAVIIMIVDLALAFIFNKSFDFWQANDSYFLVIGIYIVVVLIYLVLHELTHGVVYKFMTKQKLTFGFNGFVAWCGLKERIYVYRKTAIISLAAPLTVFGIIFIILMIAFKDNNVAYYTLSLLTATHFGGCIGDIYDLCLYAFIFKDKDTLMLDNGPKQIFYTKQ